MKFFTDLRNWIRNRKNAEPLLKDPRTQGFSVVAVLELDGYSSGSHGYGGLAVFGKLRK